MDLLEITGIVAVLIGSLWGGWKLLKSIPREIAEVLTAIADAIEDDSISREELKEIIKELGDIVEVVRKIAGKK